MELAPKFERTDRPAYETMMDYVREGVIPATIAVHNGEQTMMWTTGVVPTDDWDPKTDFDAFLGALVALRRAKREAESKGLHVVSS